MKYLKKIITVFYGVAVILPCQAGLELLDDEVKPKAVNQVPNARGSNNSLGHEDENRKKQIPLAQEIANERTEQSSELEKTKTLLFAPASKEERVERIPLISGQGYKFQILKKDQNFLK